jgi:hypothetical protein
MHVSTNVVSQAGIGDQDGHIPIQSSKQRGPIEMIRRDDQKIIAGSEFSSMGISGS